MTDDEGLNISQGGVTLICNHRVACAEQEVMNGR